MTLLLAVAATVVAECAYTMLGALLPTLTVLQATVLAAGLHLLTHWLIARHMTRTAATEVSGIVLVVELITHAFHLESDLLRAAMHMSMVTIAHLLRRWFRRR